MRAVSDKFWEDTHQELIAVIEEKKMGNCHSEKSRAEVELHRWIARLSHADMDERRNAAQNIQKQPIGFIREVGGIESLVALLEDEVETTRESAVRVLQGLICKGHGVNVVVQDAVREAGGIEFLVALLADKSEDMRGNAAHMLEYLAYNNPANQDAIRQACGITASVALLKKSVGDVRRLGVAALRELASNEQNKDAIREAGGIPLLVALLTDKVAEVRKNAEMVLELLGHPSAPNPMDYSASPMGEKSVTPDLTDDISVNPLPIPLEEVVQIIRFKDLCYAVDTGYVGKDAFSRVYKGRWKGVDVAIKEFLFQGLSEEAIKELRKEAIIMQGLRHPNIMPLYGVCVEPGHRSLVMPYQRGGSLRDMLSDSSQKLSWQLRWNIALGISRGVSYLHAYKPTILHRDLKSPNVMLNNSGAPIVADFGLSKAKMETRTEMGADFPPRDSLPWMAPEMFKPPVAYSKASDIFSLGLIFWELAARRQPWSEVSAAVIPFFVLKGKREPIPPETPRPYRNLITRCWEGNLVERPTIAEVVRNLEICQTAGAIHFKGLRYSKADYLGAGSFGNVFKGVWHGVDVAIKELKAQEIPTEAVVELRREGALMKKFSHPNIMHIYGVCMDPGHYSLVMQYMPRGSLYTLINDSAKEINWPRRLAMALGIARGLKFLHDAIPFIIHRDLKSLNIMLDERDVPVITDFGLSKVKTSTRSLTNSQEQGVGTVPWMAPEMFESPGKYIKESDIFSLGVILWELAARKQPWSEARPELIAIWVVRGNREAIPPETPRPYRNLIKRCWEGKPVERPTIAEVVETLEACQATL